MAIKMPMTKTQSAEGMLELAKAGTSLSRSEERILVNFALKQEKRFDDPSIMDALSERNDLSVRALKRIKRKGSYRHSYNAKMQFYRKEMENAKIEESNFADTDISTSRIGLIAGNIAGVVVDSIYTSAVVGYVFLGGVANLGLLAMGQLGKFGMSAETKDYLLGQVDYHSFDRKFRIRYINYLARGNTAAYKDLKLRQLNWKAEGSACWSGLEIALGEHNAVMKGFELIDEDLRFAITTNKINKVEPFLKAGKNPNGITINWGGVPFSALDYAERFGYRDVVSLLKQYGAVTYRELEAARKSA